MCVPVTDTTEIDRRRDVGKQTETGKERDRERNQVVQQERQGGQKETKRKREERGKQRVEQGVRREGSQVTQRGQTGEIWEAGKERKTEFWRKGAGGTGNVWTEARHRVMGGRRPQRK